MKSILAVSLLILGVSAPAAPVSKIDPVASGFPVWTGVTAKNYLSGRAITPSDLRHKVTILIEVEPNEKIVEQLVSASELARFSLIDNTASMNWEQAKLPRDVITVLSVRGATPKAAAKVMEQLAAAGKDEANAVALRNFKTKGCAVYLDVSFDGAPDTTGKRPFVHVFGPTGEKPLCQGALAATLKDAKSAVAKGKKEIAGWETPWSPFFGNIGEPKFNTSLRKTLEKGKIARKVPLDPVAKALLADVRSKDEEKAKEAQTLFDAINQTRSDLLLRISLEAGASPHCAYRDVQELLKYWPAEGKGLDARVTAVLSAPETVAMGKAYMKLIAWGSPDFTCKSSSEAKKIVAEIKKLKKSFAGYRESKSIKFQNAAILLDSRADEVLSSVQSQTEAK